MRAPTVCYCCCYSGPNFKQLLKDRLCPKAIGRRGVIVKGTDFRPADCTGRVFVVFGCFISDICTFTNIKLNHIGVQSSRKQLYKLIMLI